MYRAALAASLCSVAVGATASSAACGSASCQQSGRCPVDNPVDTLYGPGTYEWTAETAWGCVYSIADYPGSPDDAFEKAQEAALAQGGGVIFFPAGKYAFTKNLTIASNITIRGEPTQAPAKTGKNPGTLAPTTIFECPNRAHQGVWNFQPDAENIGVVNIFLDQCAIMFWPGLVSTSYANMYETWWFSAHDVAGMGRNKLVLGNVVRDVSLGKAQPASPTSIVYPWGFSIAIGVYVDRNALVANNLLPHSQRTENTTIVLKNSNNAPQTFNVRYPYDNRYGIDVNSILLGAVAGAYCSGPTSKCKDSSAFGGLRPDCAPWNFRTGITIRDNYVAQNGRVGISFTGGNDTSLCAPGSGTQVMNNHVDVAPNTQAITVDGVHVARGSDTNENRGYMKSGYCANITGNSGHIYRQQAGDTPYETVDGEGILQQSENGNWGYGDVIVGNDLSGGASGYILNYDLQWTNETLFANNIVNPDQSIGVLMINEGEVVGPAVVCHNNTPPAVFIGPGKTPTRPCASKDE